MIGNWDNSNCIFAVLPACLALGSKPASFNSGSFPIYQGSEAVTAFLGGGMPYEDGMLRCVATEHRYLQTTYKPTIAPSTILSVFVFFKQTVSSTLGNTFFASYENDYSGGFYLDAKLGGTTNKAQFAWVRNFTDSARVGTKSSFTMISPSDMRANILSGCDIS